MTRKDFFKKKDYKKKRYRNPFFAERRKKRQIRTKTKKIIFVFLFLLFLGGVIWLIFYSPYFIITNVQIEGRVGAVNKKARDLVEQSLKEKKYFILPQKNIFLFNPSKIEAQLSKMYFFSQLLVKKQYPHTLKIIYQQQKPTFRWLEDGQYYFVDKEGHILTTGQESGQATQLFLIENTGSPKIKDKKIQADQQWLNFICQLATLLPKTKLPSQIDRLRIQDSWYTVILMLKKGPLIYFSTRLDAKMQLDKLQLVINQKIKNDFFKKEYIDLRYGDMVYIK